MASLPALLRLLLIQSLIAIARIDAGRELTRTNLREFDYFKLSLLWPGTCCQHTRHCCSSNACCRGSNSPTEFTIHGLWPDYNDGTWPACCTQSHFNEKEISTLHDALEKYWPSFRCGSTSTCYGGKGSFWAHEWEKHGTCSFPVVRDEYSYFLMTLNVYFKYNVTTSFAITSGTKVVLAYFELCDHHTLIQNSKLLNDAGYVPSNTEKYPLGGIISVIQNAFHTTPEIACSNGAVEEIRLCFYKDFKPRECAVGSVLSKISCPQYVSLPTYASHGNDIAELTTSWTSQDEAL